MNQPTREMVLVIQDTEEERFPTCEMRGRPQVPQIHVLIKPTSTIDLLKFMLLICETDCKATRKTHKSPANFPVTRNTRVSHVTPS